MSYAYKNDVLVDDQFLSVPLNDYGFSRGYAIFELIRCYNGKPFRMDAHLDRLFEGVENLHMPLAMERAKMESLILSLIEKNDFTEGLVKIYVTMGVPVKEVFGFSKSVFEPQVFILNSPFKAFSEKYPYDERYYTKGISLCLAHTTRVEPEIKTNCYVSAIRQMLSPENKGYDDLLYVCPNGMVTECSRSNIFFVKDGIVISPKEGALGGVTKQVVIEALANLAMNYEERDVSYTEIPEMDGAFISSSTAEVMPVGLLGETSFSPDNFDLAEKIRQELHRLVDAECGMTLPETTLAA